MKVSKLLSLSFVFAALSLTTPAFAESAAVENYKKEVTRIVNNWAIAIMNFNIEATKAKNKLDNLENQSPRPADYEKQKKALQDELTNLQSSMSYATGDAQASIGLLKLETAKQEDTIPLPAFIRDKVQEIIKAKGIPLGKNISVRPSVTWDWKKNRPSSASVVFNFSSKYF